MAKLYHKCYLIERDDFQCNSVYLTNSKHYQIFPIFIIVLFHDVYNH